MPDDRPAPEERRRARRTLVAGAVLLLVLTALQVLPAPGRVGTHVAPNAGDPVLVTWILEHQARALLDDPGTLYRANIFSPEPAAIAWSDNLTAFVPAYLLAWLVTGRDSVLAYNLVTFLAFAASSLAVLLLARRLLDSPAAAVVAATAATLAMVRRSAIGHTQLAGFLFLPLALLLLLDVADRRRTRDAVLAGCCLAGLWYTAIYAFVLAAIVVPVAVVAWAATHRAELDRRLGLLVLVVGLVTIGLVAPSLPPYLDLQQRATFTRGDDELVAIGPASFTQPPSPLYRALGQDDGSTEGTDGFVGWTVLALAAAALALAASDALRRRVHPRSTPKLVVSVPRGGTETTNLGGGGGAAARRRRFAPSLGAACVVAALLSLGPDDGVLSLPYRAARAAVPGLDSARVLSRFWYLPALGLALLAGRGLERLAGGRPWVQRAAGAGVVALLVAELLVRPGASPVDDGPAASSLNVALAGLGPGAVTELPVPPLPHYPYVLAVRQLRSLDDGHPRVEGYSGDAPAGLPAYQQAVQTFPSPASVAALRLGGVRHVLLHGGPTPCASRYGPAELDGVLRQLDDLPVVEDVLRVDGGAVVTLTPGPPPVPLTAVVAPPAVARTDEVCAVS